MTTPKIYVPLNTSGAVHVLYDTGEWWTAPAIAQGWRSARRWNPAPAVVRRLTTAHNGIQHIYRAERLETPRMREWLGIPSELPQ